MNQIHCTQHRARFISFEGIDGAGKTTHIDTLARVFTDAGHTVVRTREPGGTPLAEQLRNITLHSPMDGATEAILMFAARRDHVRSVIAPALAAGSVVLCDRFTDATFAYQGGGRDVDWHWLQQLEQLVLGDWEQGMSDARHHTVVQNTGQNSTSPAATATACPHAASPWATAPHRPVLQPDLTLWFALSPAVAAQRLAHVRVPDRFESEPASFFEAVHHAYVRRMVEAPQRIVRIDADQPVSAVASDVLTAIRSKGWLEP